VYRNVAACGEYGYVALREFETVAVYGDDSFSALTPEECRELQCV
jgi:hypothetical protein